MTDVVTDRRRALLDLLKSRSYARRKVTLASGKESDFYIDCKQTTLHPQGLRLSAELFCQALAALKEKGVTFDAVAGPTLGADPIIAAVSVVGLEHGLFLPAVIVRKEAKDHGTGQFLEGVSHLAKGARLAMFEDVVTSGGSMLKAVDRVVQAGYVVEHCFALVDREEGGKEALAARGLTLITLFTRGDFA